MLGSCTNDCGRIYDKMNYREFIVAYHENNETKTRVLSICDFCIVGLNDDRARFCFNQDKEYDIKKVADIIFISSDEKLKRIEGIKKRQYVAYGLNYDELIKKL